MLNSAPLNASPLNGVAGQAAEPEYIVRGQSFVWALRVTVGGVNQTAILTGTVTVDREEGAAGVAGFDLFVASGPVVPTDWTGKAVTIDYISTSQGATSEVRRFTGQLSQPVWNPITRILSCECSDQLQQRVEAMTVEAIDSLTGGYWSADVFDAVTGRSRWDYAVERMGSRPASLDCSPTGDMRVTSWYAMAPHFEFGPGTTVYGSVDVELAQLGDITNRIEIEISYRYPRLWQLIESFGWAHPNADGLSGIGGFCAWRTWSTELPDTDMIESAVTGAGLSLIGGVGGYQLPLSMANPCGDGVAWTNTFEGLWLSAGVNGGRRWTQTVTEYYTLTLTTAEGQIEGTQRIGRDSANFEIESNRSEDWSGSLETDPNAEPGDLSDEARRVSAITCLLRRGRTEIISAHRGTTVSWAVPTSMASTVDLAHTLSIDDQGARAIGKCRRIVDSFDLNSGEALTTLSIAVMRGGGVSDPLTVPAAPSTSLPPLSGGNNSLPTQLGGRLVDPETGFTIPPYDPDRLGFSGNYSVKDDLTAPDYPRRFDLEARDIPAEYRDERAVTAEATYLVGIPNDLLEL
ncbi:MAG: hypothetical protein CMK99_13665 [Pseudomonas sp.]|nr:hypothetical protein [Pseudomonas sp.]HBS80999.1 hypothetical protein [Pseudomonas sp.]|tara:strand:- start:4207 stop:5931 length:1725 start_codon:yes stop_codon:yes gene_type:complete